MNFAEATGKTVDMAIKAAVEQLGADIDDVKIEILETPTKGIFGLGGRLAKVRVTLDEGGDAPAEAPKKEEIKETVKEPKTRAPKAEAPRTEKKFERREAVKKDTVCTEDDVKTVVEFLNGIFELSGIDVKADGKISSYEDGDAVCVDISGNNTGLVIGKRGETITALQHLASLALSKKSANAPRAFLDSENYREKRVEALKALSNRVANNVVKTHRNFTFEPMSAYERRVIHATLQGNDKVTTYSVGQGIHRKVVVTLKK